MFTGIIEATAAVRERTETGLILERPAAFDDLKPGSSVCVHGACLTVTDLTEGTLSFDVMPETWSKTNFGDLQPGDAVNLERSLRADARFDGHFVQGHVEGVGMVEQAGVGGGGHTLQVALPADLAPFVLPKGSIAIDGVSLTVAALSGQSCILALIPITLRETTLGTLQPGDRVNCETDILVRTVASLLPRS